MSSNDTEDKIRRDVNASTIISKELEENLVNAWRIHGDKAARNQLVEAHQKLVANMASRFARSGASFADLFNEGMIALIAAADRFDVTRECRFSTYASWWILSQLQEAMHRDIYTVKIGRSRNEKKILRLLTAARQMLGGHLDGQIIRRIAELTGVDEEVVRQVDGAISSRSVSLNATMGEDGAEYGDNIEDAEEETHGAEATILRRDQRRILEEVFGALTDRRAAEILTSKWLSDEEWSLKDIGEKFSVSAERIRQIEREALAEARTALLARGLKLEEILM